MWVSCSSDHKEVEPQHSHIFRRDASLCIGYVLATAAWLAGCLKQPVLYQNY